jgi:hypothetical protein
MTEEVPEPIGRYFMGLVLGDARWRDPGQRAVARSWVNGKTLVKEPAAGEPGPIGA